MGQGGASPKSKRLGGDRIKKSARQELNPIFPPHSDSIIKESSEKHKKRQENPL